MLGLHAGRASCCARTRARKVGEGAAIRWYRDSKGREIEPLRILYCGSDDFSVGSLRSLTEAHRQDSSFIESIDVVCKPPARYGRGLKQEYKSPIAAFAKDAKLPVHPISTFTKWQPPTRQGKDVNLIIAVSFGLFVPPRLLNRAQYGGLNIHPSLLPALRGPAPIKHTLLQSLQETGISLCTLHPKHFDNGVILRQDSFSLPAEDTISYRALVHYLAPRGADLLIKGLVDGCFMRPMAEVESTPAASHAPKLGVDDARVDWKTWSADKILNMQKVNWPLWNVWNDSRDEKRFKVVFPELKKIAQLDEADGTNSPNSKPGTPFVFWLKDDNTWQDWTGTIVKGLPGPLGQDLVKVKDVNDDFSRVPLSKGARKGLPGVCGMWTCDGYFLAFSTVQVQQGTKSVELGPLDGVRRLWALATDRSQRLQ